MLNLSHLRLLSYVNYSKIMNWKTDNGDYRMRIDAMSDAPQVEYWWESSLDRMVVEERIIFLVVFTIITAFGVIGNILTLYVIFAR